MSAVAAGANVETVLLANYELFAGRLAARLGSRAAAARALQDTLLQLDQFAGRPDGLLRPLLYRMALRQAAHHAHGAARPLRPAEIAWATGAVAGGDPPSGARAAAPALSGELSRAEHDLIRAAATEPFARIGTRLNLPAREVETRLRDILDRCCPPGKPVDVRWQAIAWLVRLRSGQAHEGDLGAYYDWREADARHGPAFDEAAAVWRGLAEPDARALPQHRLLRSAMAVSRRQMLGGAAAALAVMGGIAIFRPGMARPDFATARGERRQVALAAGLVLDLNTDSSLLVHRSADAHIVELLSGEAFVNAAAPLARPLILIARGGKSIATRASFMVRCLEDGARITCVEGALNVAGEHAIARVEARQQIAYANGRLEAVREADLTAATAWRSGRLVFRNDPLREVIAEVNRYRRDRIVLANSALGARRVSGVFPLDRTDELLDQIRDLFGARITTLPGVVVVR